MWRFASARELLSAAKRRRCIASIEGRRGTPKPRPPYPAVSGLWGKPTLINNVETFANIAPIIRNGGKWFANMGSERSKGTKVFALTGKITNTGLVEVPMGIKLREIIEVIGGGVPGRPHLQGGADRRSLRRLHSRRDARHRRQLRRPASRSAPSWAPAA